MHKVTQFEDFSNELFLQLFDYLYALDLFIAFSSLNKRISLILCSTQLRVVISKLHCRHQIILLSSYLIDHAHQVVFLSLRDQLRDFSSVISFLFDRHTFVNLRSCKLYSISSSSNLDNVIQQLESLTKLVLIQISQSSDKSLSKIDKHDLSQTIITHRSPNLRSVKLLFLHDYSNLTADTTLNWTLTSLQIIFHGSTNSCSIFSILPVLRTYCVLRRLNVYISNTHPTVMPMLPSIYENNLPISSSMKIFDLDIRTNCDFPSLSLILRCMPNLRQFIVAVVTNEIFLPFGIDLFNGHQWQEILDRYVSHLDAIDLLLSIIDLNWPIDMNVAGQSFKNFSKKYDDWHVAINRSRYHPNRQETRVTLRAFRHLKKTRYYTYIGGWIVLGTVNTQITGAANTQYHHCYSNYSSLHICVPLNLRPLDIIPSSPIYKKLSYLAVLFVLERTTLWEIIKALIRICFTDDTINQRERFTKLTSIVDLTHITEMELHPSGGLSQVHFIEQILSASPNMVRLMICHSFIISSTLFNNPSLISVYDRLQSLHLKTKCFYFPTQFASSLVERSSSLIHIEFETFLLDTCIPFVDILVGGLAKLSHLKIHFNRNLFPDELYLMHVIHQRRQAFPLKIWNEDEFFVKREGQIMDIYLSGCSICVYFFFGFSCLLCNTLECLH